MVMRLRWREETLHVRLGPGAQERPEPVIQHGVGYGVPALLSQVLIPACDDEHLDEPLLTVALLGARKLGAVSRALAGRMLGQQVAPPPPPRRQPGVVGWIRAGLTDPVGWRSCAYLLLKLPVAL